MSLDFTLIGEIDEDGEPEMIDFNITHNLVEMAEQGGIYKCLWRPSENGFNKARDVINPISRALVWMNTCPSDFTKYNASNGWGTYDQFFAWSL